MVLGHANCGAVKAAMAGKPVPGQISLLFGPLQPAVEAGPRQPGGCHQSQCAHPGQTPGDSVTAAERVDQERRFEDRGGLLRARYKVRSPC